VTPDKVYEGFGGRRDAVTQATSPVHPAVTTRSPESGRDGPRPVSNLDLSHGAHDLRRTLGPPPVGSGNDASSSDEKPAVQALRLERAALPAGGTGRAELRRGRNGHATGYVWGFAEQAGFSTVTVLPVEHDF
jgi:hypothetical protein